MARAWLLVAAALLALAAIVAVAAAVALRAPELTKPNVRAEDGPEPCFGDLPEAPPALRGLDRERSASLHRELQQNVSLDEDTVMSVIALSRATGVPVALDEIANRTTHRLEICSFDLAIHEGDAAYAVRRVVAFRVTTVHTASLDRDTAMRAIALNASGVPVDPRDVITFAHDERNERAFDQVVDSADVLKLVMAQIKEDAALSAAGAPRAPSAPSAAAPPPIQEQAATTPPPAPTPSASRPTNGPPLGPLLGLR